MKRTRTIIISEERYGKQGTPTFPSFVMYTKNHSCESWGVWVVRNSGVIPVSLVLSKNNFLIFDWKYRLENLIPHKEKTYSKVEAAAAQDFFCICRFLLIEWFSHFSCSGIKTIPSLSHLLYAQVWEKWASPLQLGKGPIIQIIKKKKPIELERLQLKKQRYVVDKKMQGKRMHIEK